MGNACCAIGARPDAAAIDAALRAGNGLRALEKLFPGASKSSLSKHRAECLGIRVEDLGDEAPANAFRVRHAPPKGQDEESENPINTAPNDARATRPEEANAADSYEERVNHVADLIAAGDYMGRSTVNELSRRWGVTRQAVQNYHRAAALLVKGDHGEREELRQVSLARWQQLYTEARLAEDLHAAVKAQAGWDRAAGVVESGGAKVAINIGLVDAGNAVARFIQQVIPEHGPAFVAWFEAVQSGDQRAMLEPAAWVAGWRGREVLMMEAARGNSGP